MKPTMSGPATRRKPGPNRTKSDAQPERKGPAHQTCNNRLCNPGGPGRPQPGQDPRSPSLEIDVSRGLAPNQVNGERLDPGNGNIHNQPAGVGQSDFAEVSTVPRDFANLNGEDCGPPWHNFNGLTGDMNREPLRRFCRR